MLKSMIIFRIAVKEDKPPHLYGYSDHIIKEGIADITVHLAPPAIAAIFHQYGYLWLNESTLILASQVLSINLVEEQTS